MIRVYFETHNNGYASQIATFYDEEAYDAAIAGLEKWAKKNNGHITESVVGDD
jgi:hypothetical protein